MSQIDQDSSSVIKELTLDDEEDTEQEDEVKESVYDRFLKKEDRNYEWKPSGQKNIPDSVINGIKKEDAFWYADMAPKKEKMRDEKKRNTSLFGQQWFNTLIWIIILGGFAFFLISYLAGSNVGLFRKKSLVISEKDSETMPEDIFAINYQKEIERATAGGNFRLAVRLQFLSLLKNMSEKEIINYKQDKTNFDYLTELSTSSFYQTFFKITRNYEYTWYGQFEISKGTYQLIKDDFIKFENQLS